MFLKSYKQKKDKHKIQVHFENQGNCNSGSSYVEASQQDLLNINAYSPFPISCGCHNCKCLKSYISSEALPISQKVKSCAAADFCGSVIQLTSSEPASNKPMALVIPTDVVSYQILMPFFNQKAILRIYCLYKCLLKAKENSLKKFRSIGIYY